MRTLEGHMSEWNATSYQAKDNLLRVHRREAEALFEMAANGPWTGATACTQWETRDIVGHLIDVTESYFVSFDAARSGAAVADPLGLRVMQESLDTGAKEHQGLTQSEAVERLRADFAKMMEISEALGPEEWGGLMVPHKYMGPLPAFFYPWFQLVDYGVQAGISARAPAVRTACWATPRTCSRRSCSSCGRPPRTFRPIWRPTPSGSACRAVTLRTT